MPTTLYPGRAYERPESYRTPSWPRDPRHECGRGDDLVTRRHKSWERAQSELHAYYFYDNPKDLFGIGLDLSDDNQELDKIDSALSSFVIRDEGLRLAKPVCQFLLVKFARLRASAKHAPTILCSRGLTHTDLAPGHDDRAR